MINAVSDHLVHFRLYSKKAIIKRWVRPFFEFISQHSRFVIAPGKYSDGRERRSVHTSVEFKRVKPVSIGNVHRKFSDGAPGLKSASEETFIRVMPMARVIGQQGLVLNHSNEVSSDSLLSNFHSRHLIENIFFKKPTCIKAKSLLLSGNYASDNYFHWMTEALPKLAIAYDSGYVLSDFNRVIVSSNLHAFQKETLAHLGIGAEEIHSLREAEYVICDSLIAPSDTCLSGNVSPWIIQFLRRSFTDLMIRDTSMPLKIYIGRNNSSKRILLNENRLIEELSAHGFSTINPEKLSFAEQVKYFFNAKEIIAVHGAALTNIIFCKPGTMVIELFPVSYVNQCYWVMACENKLHYGYVLGEGEDDTDIVNHQIDRDFEISVPAVLATRKKLIEQYAV